MARSPKSSSSPQPKRGKRLTSGQKAQILQALDAGEPGAAIALRMGVSAQTIYAYRRKSASTSAATPSAPVPSTASEISLRGMLVRFAMRTLLGQEIDAAERASLQDAVFQVAMRGFAA